MPDDRIATVRPIKENEATGRVAAIFADIKRTKNIDFVPAFWRTIATNPTQLEVVWTNLKTLMHPEAVDRPARLDPKMREMIALAVSATNACPYCINSHTAALRKMAGTMPPPGTNVIVVTHKPNIVDAFGKDWFDVREGEASVFKPDGSGGYKFIVRIQANEWSKLAQESN